jgi:hypothetical protein
MTRVRASTMGAVPLLFAFVVCASVPRAAHRSAFEQPPAHVARTLEQSGEKDAAAFVRQEILRRVSNASELATVRRALIGSEPAIGKAMDQAFAKAKTDAERLNALVEETPRARADPFAHAGLLAAGASALRTLGFDTEGRRAFGELIERAPGDLWPLAYVGDRLRGEGHFDDAVAVCDRLDAMMLTLRDAR